ncbi:MULTISPECIES: TIGR03364 family FAD-dependent oxidoreductase [unclassified Aquimarina]|uniref:TIGR03364 family FAD-dependent oxidoreductase n=1 Tax=unclassified Aquimarina TaxID=2627091 RepID=UPI0018C9F0A6|nr:MULTISPECIES: TIGR03364 family FAD-dependent oxidoreductase [unclassified Aquimarina]
MMKKYDLIVVGGGVLGTFHAYHALQNGLQVALLEKNRRPQGATTQNFGQVVPSGMNTKWQTYGRESLKIYKEIQQQFDITLRENGSVYLASNHEEVQLIEELHQINKNNQYTSVLLTKEECLKKYPGLRSDYIEAGLFFPEEVTVESREMIHRLQDFMVKHMNLAYFTNQNVISCEEVNTTVKVTSSSEEVFEAEKVIICNGNEFKNLYPKLFSESDLEVTKLQMLQTKPQSGYQLPGNILTGWSIRRYEAFTECAAFSGIKSQEDPDSLQKKWGVHILFKQAPDGSVIVGDSHEYADAKHIEDLGYDLDMNIDDFMISEAQKIIDLPTYDIQNRWYGMYSQCKTKDVFQETIGSNIHIITGIGGKGMTGSAGFAKENITRIFNI